MDGVVNSADTLSAVDPVAVLGERSTGKDVTSAVTGLVAVGPVAARVVLRRDGAVTSVGIARVDATNAGVGGLGRAVPGSGTGLADRDVAIG